MNANETASLIATLAVERDAREGLEARIEVARETLESYFYTPGFVGTRAYDVVSKALFELAGEEG